MRGIVLRVVALILTLLSLVIFWCMVCRIALSLSFCLYFDHACFVQLILPLQSFFPVDADGNSALPQMSILAMIYHNTPDTHSLGFMVGRLCLRVIDLLFGVSCWCLFH